MTYSNVPSYFLDRIMAGRYRLFLLLLGTRGIKRDRKNMHTIDGILNLVVFISVSDPDPFLKKNSLILFNIRE